MDGQTEAITISPLLFLKIKIDKNTIKTMAGLYNVAETGGRKLV